MKELSYSICGLMLDGSCAGETEPTTEKIDCKQCLDLAHMCQKIDTKL